MNNKINIENYEIFWIDYLDDKLSDEEIELLFDFLESNQDVASNLIDIESFKLPVINTHYPNKEILYSENQIENMIIAKIENQISNENDVFLLKQIKRDVEVKKTYNIYKKTLLQANQEIVYPNKKSLYRVRKLTINSFKTLLVAASFVLIAIAGLFILKNNSGISDINISTISENSNESTLTPKIGIETILLASTEDVNNLETFSNEVISDVKENLKNEQENDLYFDNAGNTEIMFETPSKLPLAKMEQIVNKNDNQFIFMEYRFEVAMEDNLYAYTLENEKNIFEEVGEELESTKDIIRKKIKDTAKKVARFRYEFDIVDTYEKIKETREDFLTTNKR